MTKARISRREFTVAAAGATLLPAASSPRQLWADTRTSHLGAPSPDGKLLSIVDPATGDLAVRETATGAVRRLTRNPAGSPEFAYFSVFSRDGRQIAYAWYNRERIYELRTIGVDGNGMRVLHSHPERRFVQPCAWTADGKRILTLFFRGDNVSQIALVEAGSGKVDVLKSLDWIYPNRMDLSPDGKWIAYDDLIREGDSRRTIHLLATDGSTHRTLLKAPSGETFPLFAPSGDAVTYLRGGTIYRYDLRQPGPERMLHAVGQALPMGFTRGGDYYYAVRNNQFALQIADFDAAPGPGRPYSASLPVINAAPSWSADGKRIAFLARAANENFGQESRIIVIREVDGNAGTVLPPRLAHTGWVRWMPDGKALLAGGSDRHGQRGLYRIDIASGDATPLVREPAETYDGFEGLPSGPTEAVYLQGSQLRKTGADAPLYAAPAGRLHSLTADRDQLYFVLETAASTDILAFDGRIRRLAFWKGDPILGLEASPDSLIALTKEALWRIPLAAGSPERLPWKLTPGALPRFAPGGKRLAWISGSARTEIWVAERLLDVADHQR
ncbi:MAG: PD40 domain-containing protein [Bryobacterales bacterium]|nr:PD40 domain-containing protein [Bryobacterales bacterium]